MWFLFVCAKFSHVGFVFNVNTYIQSLGWGLGLNCNIAIIEIENSKIPYFCPLITRPEISLFSLLLRTFPQITFNHPCRRLIQDITICWSINWIHHSTQRHHSIMENFHYILILSVRRGWYFVYVSFEVHNLSLITFNDLLYSYVYGIYL